MALASPSWDSESAIGAAPDGRRTPEALAFMPRLFVLTTLPHRRPEGNLFERVNGWQSAEPASPFAGTRRTAPTAAPSLHVPTLRLGLPGTDWRSRLLLHEHFFSEINRSAVPVDLRAVHHLQGSHLAFDLYTWLTHRMSYLRRPTLVPWKGLQAQLGADYARTRDFRRTTLAGLEDVVGVYPRLRIR